MKPRKASRTYTIQHFANETKLDAIREMLPLWQSCSAVVQLIQTRKLRNGEPLGWLTADELKPYRLPLSARQLKSVVNQVNIALRSWEELTKRNVRAMIRDGGYTDDERRELYRINLHAAWWSDPRTARLVEVSLRDIPFPNVGRNRTMIMDSIVCKAEASEDTQFDTWLRISTLTKGKPVLIPVSRSGYFRSRPGTEAGVTQVHVAENGTVTFRRVKQFEVVPERTDGEVVGLDWGLASMFTTSDGRRLGTRIYTWLQKRDAELTALTASLQQQGIKPSQSKRYRNLNRRIREYVRNEVGRLLNGIAACDVREIVTEELDFRHGGLSRQMNRIISRAGRGAVKAKLASLTETHGIAVTEVNPAYTSQQCNGCGFTDKANRRSQSRFECRFCGKKLHADIKAARTILSRRSAPGAGYVWCRKGEVLTFLDADFQQRWGISAAEIRERQARGHSTATSAPRAA